MLEDLKALHGVKLSLNGKPFLVRTELQGLAYKAFTKLSRLLESVRQHEFRLGLTCSERVWCQDFCIKAAMRHDS